MIPKIYKPVLFIMALLAICKPVLAQDKPDSSEVTGFDSEAFNKSMRLLDLKLELNTKHLELAINKLDKNLNEHFKNFDQQLPLYNLASQISVSVNDIVKSVNIDIIDNGVESKVQSGDVRDRIKNYSKSYAVDANDKLAIDNKYGKVTINTWSKNEIKVDVQIKGSAGDSETAQKLVDAISISDSKDGNVVSFRTNFGNGSGSKWNLFSNMNDHHKAEVNYTIYMPSTIALDMRNRYGAVVLPSLSGKVVIDNAYGSLTARALSNPSNELRFRYYEVNIEELSGGALDLSYGSLKLGNVGKLEANVNYAPIDIGRLTSSGSFNVRYGGGIKINEISKALKNLDINSTYSSVNINLRGDESFDFDVTVKYGSFNYDENKVKITSKSPSDDERGYHPTKNYKGYMGNSNSSNRINISSTYQSVKLE
ncbi:MAG: hypothetical protein JWR54_1355 [Mucilaginibacter sp.]|nr:hypothetical protein [Mucilaginibacter sp.]